MPASIASARSGRRRTENADDGSRGALANLRGHVAFDRVWFAYTEGVPVLRDVTFDAPAGSTTALVGSSGSGKSTLVSLVMAFNRPTEGVIRIDDRDLASLRLADYRAHLGIVLQDNFLFDGTIADNIRYGRPHATAQEVQDAARVAYCDEFVEGFADKYETVVGERGVRLSGGQRQRVAIARAILADPRILILDEATSSLDSESEAKIQQALRALRRGRTTFVIAHRLSTIRSADQILVLESGQIVERGSHGQLYRPADGIASCTTASTSGSTSGSSIRGKTSRPSRPGEGGDGSLRSIRPRRPPSGRPRVSDRGRHRHFLGPFAAVFPGNCSRRNSGRSTLWRLSRVTRTTSDWPRTSGAT